LLILSHLYPLAFTNIPLFKKGGISILGLLCHKRPGHFRNYDLILPEGYGEVLSGGIWIERSVRFLTGRKHIIEIQPFPRAPGTKNNSLILF